MTIIITLALLCAVILAVALHPVMTGDQSRLGWRLLVGMAVAAVGIYMAVGSPDAKTAPAAFEHSGPRYEQRLASQRELVILEGLSGAPDHVPFLLELGTVRIQSGHPQDALEPLERAQALKPKDQSIQEALGAAHYAIALTYAIQPRKDARPMALKHFEKALKITPKSTEFYQRLRDDVKNYQRRDDTSK
jgi:tetratricopeptide (TPR) repeat protein